MKTSEKLLLLRKQMQTEGVDAFVVFSADPHLSEYLPKEWLERQWISGFTGSAGFVVITEDKAGLWTDSRYFVQAPIELEGSGIDLFKEGVEGTPDYTDWLLSELPEKSVVAVNALATSHVAWEKLEKALATKHIELKDNPLLNKVWVNREKSPLHSIFVHPDKWAGQTVAEKLKAIREKMKQQKANLHIITALDDVAWTLNLRGSDVAYNPVFLGYIVLSNEDAFLFVDTQKVTDEVRAHLTQANVTIRAYSDFFPYLTEIKDKQILIAPNTNQAIFKAIQGNVLIQSPVPGNLMKAVKNATELEGFRTVMVRDGVALAKFFYWLTHQVGKEPMTEYSIGVKLREFRAAGENFVGESFGSIVGYQGNGAIVHYSAPETGSKEVFAEGSILVDSGGQYLEGTTDITRTIPLGKVSQEFINDSTLALKGMIQLSLVKFPKGTRGVQLDAFARMALWKNNKDYGHGTGHGVGSFMNVHEGPQNIRKDMNPQELLPGMVCSNEPGFYLENKYGIRHENLVAVREVCKNEFGTFCDFETLTLCPFMATGINPTLLTDDEKQWLNAYHKTCEEKIAPHLEGEVKTWFLELVKPL
ncbi:Xaa-Pro aminopeptidase [Capnocytophaga sp. H4358]|uniref:aminopeptidase P family protein n=1 Tax=Capnocytophaga sp. H4358 TaxID=1945658 RepID=UPI000BB1A831|nr:aminopeptidase P family protein [Capnocytophaga sp. H4358]ATA73911.1 Xaa-Pro aminopeptidase [Capnocytophaga sp. H4358]